MAFQTPMTVSEVIDKIDGKKYLLPYIQREFVWDTEQITMLFDSLMRDYPISTFLFWEVKKEKLQEFTFYEFLRDYHQQHRHNKKANLNGKDGVVAVLDGQQRLTSLYIGLKGSYAYKLPRKKWNNPDAFPARKLYLNLLQRSENSEYEYEFKFLTESEAEKNDNSHHWFLVGNILNMKSLSDVMKYWSKNIVYGLNCDDKKAEFANDTLSKLFEVIHVSPSICYYLENSSELDKVLNIFIRVNRGGTALSYSDLLLSFAAAQWNKLDAREVIYNFVDEINGLGNGFNITKDFVLKACLVLCDCEDISFKVDNFNRKNMLKIQNEWDNIAKAIKSAVLLVASFGFSRENITSNNLFIPIAYYLKKIGLPNNFETSSSTSKDRIAIKKWFTRSLLKKVFSFMPDGVLKPIRKIIQNMTTNEFPLQQIIEKFKGTNRSLVFTDDDITNLLWAKYGKGNTIIIMSVLYPWADMRNQFHIDHIYPKSLFTKSFLSKKGLSDEEITFAMDNCNYLANLQLLESIPNIEKSSKEFNDWINETIPKEAINEYKTKHLMPTDVELNFKNFENFFLKREALITEKLKKELQ